MQGSTKQTRKNKIYTIILFIFLKKKLHCFLKKVGRGRKLRTEKDWEIERPLEHRLNSLSSSTAINYIYVTTDLEKLETLVLITSLASCILLFEAKLLYV